MRENPEQTPAKQRNLLRKLAKKLHAVINLADQLDDYWCDNFDISSRMRDLEKLAQAMEADAAVIGKKKGARPYNEVRAVAVWKAHTLLTEYSKPPTLYREGDWHELARVLFGDEQADLFDYMEDYLARLQSAKDWIITPVTPK